MTTSFTSSPGESLGLLLWRVMLRWKRAQKRALEPFGLTHVQFVVLAGLAWHAESGLAVTQAQLAAFIDADKMMVSQVVRALVARDLVTRSRSTDDGRAYVLALTAAARALVPEAVRAVEAVDTAFFGPLDDTEPFRRALRRLLAVRAAVS